MGYDESFIGAETLGFLMAYNVVALGYINKKSIDEILEGLEYEHSKLNDLYRNLRKERISRENEREDDDESE